MTTMTERIKYISGYFLMAAALYVCAACSQVQSESYANTDVEYHRPVVTTHTPAHSTPTHYTDNTKMVEMTSNNMWYWN